MKLHFLKSKSFLSACCLSVGMSLFASFSSAAPMIRGECWLDDDTSFDDGQIDGGVMFAPTSARLNATCRKLMNDRFGDNGSFLVKNATMTGTYGLVQGECWIDDDTSFDWDQISVGPVIGIDSLDNLEECQEAAAARYGANGSYGVKASVLVQGGQIEADCWIDDDVDFDWDQVFGGKLYGYSTRSVRQECQEIARHRYGDAGSSGIKNVRLVEDASGFFQGECWVDDDTSFDWDQINAGAVIARTTRELNAECAWVASTRYGTQGSSGVRNVVPVSGFIQGVQGDCWLDDDTQFDWDQINGGRLFGSTTWDLRRECQDLAAVRFGTNGTSGVKNISTY